MKVITTEILDLFQRWNDALQTGDPKLVSILYAREIRGMTSPHFINESAYAKDNITMAIALKRKVYLD
ncbi:hypothetical protein [Vibrio aquimaris]|uniref:Uncharacterized protein n=1 Tax=Vibrio aquimaris TaxID=2587862 RepID=A0A5P9CS09_9VIBR|nr:hypothetical protein [Vibrio aquimaris]QFT28472.1 hypothetical protein FIV01_18920 [Vibrio aquimaris]